VKCKRERECRLGFKIERDVLGLIKDEYRAGIFVLGQANFTTTLRSIKGKGREGKERKGKEKDKPGSRRLGKSQGKGREGKKVWGIGDWRDAMPCCSFGPGDQETRPERQKGKGREGKASE
jgi:hypothetical protein